jgi:hypothetical protein
MERYDIDFVVVQVSQGGAPVVVGYWGLHLVVGFRRHGYDKRA